MKIEEIYQESLKYCYYSMVLFLEIAVKKSLLNLEDDSDKIQEILQNGYKEELNQEIRLAGIQRGYWK